MAETGGKTARLLSRLPHFYNPQELGRTLLNVYQTLGLSLEQSERALFEVLKAHHVQTAENVGSKGYIAPAAEHGDLDKLFSLYLESLGGTSQLVSMNPLFTLKSFDVEKILNTLYHSTDIEYERLKNLLVSLDDHPQPVDDLETYLTSGLQFSVGEINGAFAFALLLHDSPVTAYIHKLLSDKTLELLFAYDGKGSVSEDLSNLLVQDLNEKVLKDPFFFQNNIEYFGSIHLDSLTLSLRNSLHKVFLKKWLPLKFESDPDYFKSNTAYLQAALKDLDYAEPPAIPVMNDIQRLNRMLLDQAATAEAELGNGWGFVNRSMPSINLVREIIKTRLNNLLLSDHDQVRSFFDELLINSDNGSRLTIQYKDDRLMLRRFLLESVFPYEIKHIYRIYQDRLQALIKVLRTGASTKQGILDIVAANFGLIGDTSDVLKSKQLIRIKEFDPVGATFADNNLALRQSFVIKNENQDITIPKIKLTMLVAKIKSIRNIKIINADNEAEFFTIPHTMKEGDNVFLEDTSIIFNGVMSSQHIEGNLLALPANQESRWMVDAEILSNSDGHFGTYGRFGSTQFGDAIFINDREPVLQVEILSSKLTYGAFSIVIPWHIEGVTDNFAETKDHPRHKIRSLVSKVKAAGVRVNVAYLKDFSEIYDYSDRLNFSLRGQKLNEALEPKDDFTIDSMLGSKENHELNDGLRTSGVFDYTAFGSGNTFD